MPFPLAHPSVVLPVKRWFPRHFDFMALVVGAIVPDVGYALSRYNLDEFSHSFIGGFEFCLPVGLAMLATIWLLRTPCEQMLPARERAILQTGFALEKSNGFKILISLMTGIWTHQIWDTFTHRTGWVVDRVPMLQTVLFEHRFGNQGWTHEFRVCVLIWYVSSFAGLAWLAWAYLGWLKKTFLGLEKMTWWGKLSQALMVGLIMLPVEVLHHLKRGLVSALVVVTGSFLLMAGSLFFLGRAGGQQRKIRA